MEVKAAGTLNHRKSEIQSDGATGLSGKFRLEIRFLQCLKKKELLSGVNVPKKTQESDGLVVGTSGVNAFVVIACGYMQVFSGRASGAAD